SATSSTSSRVAHARWGLRSSPRPVLRPRLRARTAGWDGASRSAVRRGGAPLLHPSFLRGSYCGLDPVPHLKPAQDLLDVCLHRVLAEVNPAGDLLVRHALGKQTQDLVLAVVEPGPGRGRFTGIHPEGSRHALALQRHKFIPLCFTQVLVKLLKPDNHLLLVLVQ